MSCLPSRFLSSGRAGTTPACISTISRLSLCCILGGRGARATWEHARASPPPAGHLSRASGAARVAGAKAHLPMGEQTPGICSRPVRPAACAARLSKSPSKSQAVPRVRDIPRLEAQGPGPTLLAAAVTAQPSVGAWVPGPSATLDQNVCVMWPASLRRPLRGGRPGHG